MLLTDSHQLRLYVTEHNLTGKVRTASFSRKIILQVEVAIQTFQITGPDKRRKLMSEKLYWRDAVHQDISQQVIFGKIITLSL